MPIYEYACGKCEQEFEAEQRISDPPLRTCPHCRSRKVKRLISRTSFVLKGSGWYSDLYSSSKKDKKGDEGGKPEKKDKADKPDKGGDAGGSEKTAADSKPAPSKRSKSGSTGSGKSQAAA